MIADITPSRNVVFDPEQSSLNVRLGTTSRKAQSSPDKPESPEGSSRLFEPQRLHDPHIEFRAAVVLHQ